MVPLPDRRTVSLMTHIGSVLSPLLVGRDDVLELATRRLDEVAAGRGQFLLLSGEAGIGKTRLIRAIAQTARAKDFILEGGAVGPHDHELPAASFRDLAHSASKRAEFGTLGQDLLDIVLGMTEAERPQRRLLVQRTVDRIEAAVTRPVMLVFEDLQWADDVSLEILAELARQTRGSRLLIAGAYRTEATEAGSTLREWRARLVTQRLVEQVRLDRLTLEETGLVTTLILGTGLPAPRDVVSAVHRRTDGVPLYIEELLGAMGPDALGDSRAIRDAHVPETLEDAVLARVSRLTEDAQGVARAGSVIGRCFAPEILAGIMDRPVTELEAAFDELVQSAILYPFEYVDRGYYDFRHQLLRDALYESVPGAKLRRFHARAAEFGQELVGASEVHASVHYERAGMRDQAFRAALSSARTAAKLSSHREAFELYRRAYENMPADLPPQERGDVIEAYSDEASAIEENDLAERLAREARELSLEAGLPLHAAANLVMVGVCWRREGHPLSERIALAREAIAELEALPAGADRDRYLPDAYGLLGWSYMDALELDAARNATRTGAEIARRLGMEAEALQWSTGLAMIDVIEGRVEDGLAELRSAADASRAKGYEACGVTAYRDAALMAVRSMRYGEAARQMLDGRRYADEIEQSHCARVMASTDAVLAWAAGDWIEATRIGEQALSDHGRGRAGAIARWGLGFVAAGRGATEAAAAHLAKALEFGERAEWLEMTLPSQWGLAENALLSGDHDAAIRHCENALDAARIKGERSLLVPFVVTGVRAYLAAGRPEAAGRWLADVSAAIGPESTVAPPAVDHGRGLVRLAGGSINAAREALESAVSGWDEKGRTWEAQWARLDLASALLRSNRYYDAARLLAEVRATAQRMESTPLLVRAAELERLARGRGSEHEAWHPLTVREFEVARQIASGMTNGEIAAALFVSPKTVSAHVEHILAKLGASRRAEIATWVASIAPVAVA